VPHSGQNFAAAESVCRIPCRTCSRRRPVRLPRQAGGDRSDRSASRRRGCGRLIHGCIICCAMVRPLPGPRRCPLLRHRLRWPRRWEGLRHLELCIALHVAHHGHADALVEDLLQLVGSERFSTTKVSSERPRSLKTGCRNPAIFWPSSISWRPCPGTAPALGEGVGHASDDGVAELALDVGHTMISRVPLTLV